MLLLKLVAECCKLVEDVSKTEITESSAIIRWKKDNKQNPVDTHKHYAYDGYDSAGR